MKTHPAFLAAAVSAALACTGFAQSEAKSEHANGHAEARAEAHADGNGQTTTQKQSVTVTSDGKRTVKKTVTVRDGKEEVVIETTDENGKTTTTREGGGESPKDEQADRSSWLGVQVKEAPPVLREQLGLGDAGVVVELVAPDSPAARAGIRRNDLLLQVAGKEVATPAELRAELRAHQAGESVNFGILRKGERMSVDVTVAQRPAQADNDAQRDPGLLDKFRERQGKDGQAKIEIEVSGDGGSGRASAGLDAVLNDPNVPEDFKKTVREMQEKMKEFEKKHAPR